MSVHISPVRVYVTVFAVLMVLTAATVWAAFQNFGAMNNVVMLGIAITKATVVVLYFMHVKYATRLTGVVVLSTLFFLSILFVFLIADLSHPGYTWTPLAPRAHVASP